MLVFVTSGLCPSPFPNPILVLAKQHAQSSFTIVHLCQFINSTNYSLFYCIISLAIR